MMVISNIANFCCIIIIVIIKSLLLLLLLSEVLGPKDLPIEASLQTWRYRSRQSSNLAFCVVWLGTCSKHYSGAMWTKWRWYKETSVEPRLPKFLCEFELLQPQLYSQELPFSVLANWYSKTTNRVCTTKPANKGESGASVIHYTKYNYLVVFSCFISWTWYY